MDLYKLIKNVRGTDYSNNNKIIEKAWTFAENAHKGQKRDSGENYFTHPVAVSFILSELM